MSFGGLTFERMQRFTATQAPLVSVTIIRADGSTPRKSGTTMLVSPHITEGTIGGGQLEFEAIEIAQSLLGRAGEWVRDVRDFPLGPGLGQCCGGYVRLLFELWQGFEKDWLATELHTFENQAVLMVRATASGAAPVILSERTQVSDLPLPLLRQAKNMLSGTSPVGVANFKGVDGGQNYVLAPIQPNPKQLFLYGAGHVGRAVVHVLRDTEFEVNWVDLDADRFPDQVPDYVTKIATPAPALIAKNAPTDAWHLVMTRSHPLDLDICHALLLHGNFHYLGLIGSATKAARFERKLGQLSVEPVERARIVCPIGLPGKTSSAPSAIALSVAADFMLRLEELAVKKPAEGCAYHE